MKKITLLLSFLALFACDKKKYNLNNLPPTYVEFGTFGGFTGAKESNYIFPNGRFYQLNSLTTDTSSSDFKKKEVKHIFKRLSNLNFEEIQSQKPGNFNHYLKYKTQDIEKEIIWQFPEQISPELLVIYNNINELMSKDEK